MTSGALCAVDGCKSSKRRDKHLTFFHLPVDDERRKTWVDLIGRPDLARPNTKPRSHYVCCLHFERSAIIHKPQLRPDALPSKLLPSLPTTSSASTKPESKDQSIQTKCSHINTLSAITKKGADRKSESVPTPHNSQTELTQTSTALSSNTPRKRRLSKELKVSEHSELKRRKLQNDLDKIKQEVE